MRLGKDILAINKQKILHSFPLSLEEDVKIIIDFLTNKTFDIYPTIGQNVFLDNEKLSIPGRVYFDEPTETTRENLSELQQTILNCIYLRHHNGFVRQQCLELIIDKTDYFIIPFTIQLLGEYVIEILYVLDRHINDQTIEKYQKFIGENPRYWKQIENRMISYWDAYYRRTKFWKLNDYIGKQIVNRLSNENKLYYC